MKPSFFFTVITDRPQIIELLRKILACTIPTEPNVVKLKSISPWLANLQSIDYNNELELPGQYDGKSKPNLQSHIKITSFSSKLNVIHSKQRPMKLNIFGDNGKSYNFLVKYGEDLRQDQRIQQLLSLMSEKLDDDNKAKSHNLFIETFKVIPINSYSGLMSWVENTETLQNLLMNSISKQNPQNVEVLVGIRKQHLAFLHHPSINDIKIEDNLNVYGRAVMSYTRDQIIAKFRELQYQITSNILRECLFNMSTSPESFYALRNNFASSLAAMNIAEWIIGVGDRHLSNILMNVKNGCAIGMFMLLFLLLPLSFTQLSLCTFKSLTPSHIY